MIVYAVVARAKDAAMLTEWSMDGETSNAAQITGTLLEHLRDHPGVIMDGERKTFVQKATEDWLDSFLEACAMTDDEEDFFFHFFFKDGVYYACLGDDSATNDQKVSFAFLDHVAKEFSAKFRPSRVQSAKPLALNSQFQHHLRSSMHHYNTHHHEIARQDKTRLLLAQVEDLRTVLGRNIDGVLRNQENVNSLVTKSDDLLAETSVFKKKTNRLRRKQQRKMAFFAGLAVLIVIFLIYLATMGICGVGLERCKAHVEQYADYANGNDAGNNNRRYLR